MGETNQRWKRFCSRLGRRGAEMFLLLTLTAALPWCAPAQQGAEAAPPRRVHLMLKDGSFQIVTSYRVVGENVRYVSAERGGAEEVVPLSLVDLDATRRWEQRHPGINADGSQQPVPIDPELLKEEADRAALTPEIAPDLSLPLQGGVLALDTYQGAPELVPVPQNGGELNRTTGHSLIRSVLNPPRRAARDRDAERRACHRAAAY